MKLKFTIPGEPKGKGRPRFTRSGPYVKTYTPEDTANYETLVKWEYKSQCGNAFFEKDTPLDMRLFIYHSIPKSTSKKKRELMLANKIRPIKKPDSSNVLKAIEDALNTVAYHDDTQVVDTMVRRFYAEQPKVIVVIQEAAEVTQ